MELKVSSPEPGPSPADCVSDPEEKEISDDDDDRNHKHRRQETKSQSSERDALEQVLTRPYRKRNKPFANGNLYREGDSQPFANLVSLQKDFPEKSESRRPGLGSFSRASLDLSQRGRANQLFSCDIGSGWGRGSDSCTWNQRECRFNSVDIASQIIQQGSVPQCLLAGRVVPNVSNAQNASWSAFGLVPGIPNGSLDPLHSLGLQGAVTPPINPPLNIGIPCQRCRDFEERGFCLRGDMCPMEHGVHRIIVEDVQGLSQFNLPVSLPGAHLMGTPAATGLRHAISGHPSTWMNSKGLHGKSSKPGIISENLGLNGASVGSAIAGGADLYNPDEPLWTNDCPETSGALQIPNPSNIAEMDTVLETDPTGRRCPGLGGVSGMSVGPQSASSVWGRISSSKSRSEMKEKFGSSMNSNYTGHDASEDPELLTSANGAACRGTKMNDEIGSRAVDARLKTQGDSGRNIRKLSQRALRTLFVNGIPQKINRREVLLSHFRKFGEVIDIHIPLNSERAFVQFSKSEEAEAALRAPDAVMGNRFIKLWWANRDSIPANGIAVGNSVPTTCGMTIALFPSQSSDLIKGKSNIQPATPKSSVAHASTAPLLVSDYHHHKLVDSDGPKVLQKKIEGLELLKEELRKKQEMLDQKRNDFRLQLDKLKKQASVVKGEAAPEQAAKRYKADTVTDFGKVASAKSSDSDTITSRPKAEEVIDNRKSADTVVSHSSQKYSVLPLNQHASLKQSICPLAPAGVPFIINRYKLDNRPTAFRIIPPLPIGLTNVSILKEHFSSYGDLSVVMLEDLETHQISDDSDLLKRSACISFKTRHSAEQAFINGKCWQGHNLQFVWLYPNASKKDIGERESTSNDSKEPSDAEVQPAGEVLSTGSAPALGNSACQVLEIKQGLCLGEVCGNRVQP